MSDKGEKKHKEGVSGPYVARQKVLRDRSTHCYKMKLHLEGNSGIDRL